MVAYCSCLTHCFSNNFLSLLVVDRDFQMLPNCLRVATAKVGFDLTKITTPTLTRYRSYLQSQLKLAPASINRYLVTLKSYFAIAVEGQKITTNPAKVVKLIPLIKSSPRQISDGEESAIVSAVTNYGSERDRTIIILMFHTGLRAAEVCQLRCEHIHLRKRSGYLEVYGKRNRGRAEIRAK
ncbi:MAG: tyrosine-type recombinase/integrase [Hydrococcus sp. SU_1_0]|nr:tyrosine-type recombinase/integrase [Hydrococcus sp. SU_1_0]NJO99053.1 tyrosine-type recombinase/integrase [Pleurocapsa sp. CRU_1_2]